MIKQGPAAVTVILPPNQTELKITYVLTYIHKPYIYILTCYLGLLLSNCKINL
jgi:hypothetical protein